ncbi:MAG: hypothetical protein AUI14_17670 [Actinobacteria bacterium 13_2_20CM_2_71_6]|nr:MAG: hypothetical protein AUI14_17670 [Actinobacteria bacterium 13_2_20CM_2_71_6]
MSLRPLVLLVFAAICLYNTGNMWGVQLVHYPLYAMVPPDRFSAYMARQNRLQTIPAIIPGVVQFLLALALPFVKPAGVPWVAVALSVALNLVIVAATAIWSARTNLALARDGYDTALVNRLIGTNWIRTISYTLQAILVVWMLARLIR